MMPANACTMRKTSLLIPAVALSVLCLSAATQAAITPDYNEFGDLPGATFGGTGIPTDPTAISRAAILYQSRLEIITLGITAHQRYANPPLSNDGMGTFTAMTGINDGLDLPPQALGATWNFGIYIDISTVQLTPTPVPEAKLSDYWFEFQYDSNPGAGVEDLGTVYLNNVFAAGGLGANSRYEASNNLHFSFFASDLSPFLDAPNSPFNANTPGEYGLALIVKQSQFGLEFARAAIVVNTVSKSVPDAGSTLALASIGFGVVAMAGRSVRRKA